MARRRRCFVEGMSWHITQRGVDRGPIFRTTSDYTVFLAVLRQECQRCDLSVHSYALMGNHVHVLATPASPRSLPDTMQGLGRWYVPFFNARYHRKGTLWEGRYRPALVHDERYWLSCMRYIELNPVRAGIVERPEQYQWSSYAHHAFGKYDPLITEHPLYSGLGATADIRQITWQQFCGQPIAPDQLDALRKAIRSGILIGKPPSPEVVSF